MNLGDSIRLIRDTKATLIPAGHEQVLPSGTEVAISQALGGAVTVRTSEGLYRIPSKDWDALGDEMQKQLEENISEAEMVADDEPFSEARVWNALKNCFDPEIPLNIVDLGLIYDLKILDSGIPGKHRIEVQMTLTAQGCGMGSVIAEDAKNQIEKIAQVDSAEVSIIWEPPWTPHMISEEGKQTLGLE